MYQLPSMVYFITMILTHHDSEERIYNVSQVFYITTVIAIKILI